MAAVGGAGAAPPAGSPETGILVEKDEEYNQGSIKELVMQNFMVHSHCIMNPGTRVNMIMGPNGAGKSTVLCALLLLFGARAVDVGRGETFADYIKHHCDKAGVTAAIRDTNVKLGWRTFRIVIERTGKSGKVSYFVDGGSVTRTALIACAKELNIQVSNLSQFLPQEKVGSFTAMTPKDILELTQRGIDDGKLDDMHKSVIELDARVRRGDGKLGELRRRKLTLTATIESLQGKIEMIKERDETEKQLQLCQLKLYWLKFTAARTAVDENKAALKEAMAALEAEKQRIAPLKDAEARADAELAKAKASSRASSAKLAKLVAQHRAAKKADHDARRAILQAHTALKQVKDSAEALQQRLEDAIKRRDEYAKKLEEQKSIEELAAEVKAAQAEQRAANAKANDADDAHREATRAVTGPRRDRDSARSELQHLQQKQRQRTNKLVASPGGKDIAVLMQAWQAGGRNGTTWSHRGRSYAFDKPVLPPMALHLEVEPQWLNAVDNRIPDNMLKSFVVQSWPDSLKFRDMCKSILGRRVDSIIVSEVRGRPPRVAPPALGKPLVPMDSVIRADDPIYLQALYDTGVHLTWLGADVDDSVMDVLRERQSGHKATVVFSPTRRYTARGSRYSSSSVYVQGAQLRDARILAASVGSAGQAAARALKAAEERLEAVLQEVKTAGENKAAAEKGAATAQRALVNAQRAHQARVKAARTLQKLEREVEAAEDRMGRDTKAEEQKRMAQFRAAAAARAKTLKALVELDGAIGRAGRALDVDAVRVPQAAARLHHAKRTYEANQQDVGRLQADVNAAKANKKAFRKAMLAAFYEARKHAPLDRCPDNDTPPYECRCGNAKEDGLCGGEDKVALPLRAQLHAIEIESLEEMESEIARLSARLSAFITSDSAMMEFQNATAELESVDAELEELDQDGQQLVEQLEAERKGWETKLARYIRAMNAKFEAYFKMREGGDGRVELNYDRNAIAEAGIRIRVKFAGHRELKDLDSKKHSGGERSFSTMMYLLALQASTPCPFRIVDEINQGMDELNERMVFEMLLRANASEESTQYFVVSPKLLSNLRYRPYVRVHVVNAGPDFPTSAEVGRKMLVNVAAKKQARRLALRRPRPAGDGDDDGDDGEASAARAKRGRRG